MIMKIYMVRHGETNWNRELKIQGRIDNPLNDLGIEQAHEVSKFFEDIKPTHIYASSLDRAFKTMNIINFNNKWDHDIIIDDNFIERDFGDFEGTIAHVYKQCDDYSKITGFEQNHELENRVVNGLKRLANEDGEIKIVTCHSHVLKATLISLFNDKYDDYINFPLKNCCVLELEFDNDEFSLIDIH